MVKSTKNNVSHETETEIKENLLTSKYNYVMLMHIAHFYEKNAFSKTILKTATFCTLISLQLNVPTYIFLLICLCVLLWLKCRKPGSLQISNSKMYITSHTF